MSRKTVVHFVLYCILGGILGFGVYYLFLRPSSNPVLEFATVRDTFTDTTNRDAAVVYFIRVKTYDSVQIRAAADYFTDQDLTNPAMPVSKRRTVLMHFFVDGDTATLGNDMLDELAYTHPEVTDPANTLLLVPGGYVMKVVYESGSTIASASDLKRTSFYMARPGIHAKDLR